MIELLLWGDHSVYRVIQQEFYVIAKKGEKKNCTRTEHNGFSAFPFSPFVLQVINIVTRQTRGEQQQQQPGGELTEDKDFLKQKF